MSRAETVALKESLPGPAGNAKPPTGTWYSYTTSLNCNGQEATGEDKYSCKAAKNACANIPGAPENALSTTIYARREPATTESAWVEIGTTCWAEDVPDRTDQQGPSLRQLINAEFRRTPFATPAPSFQPKTTKPFINKDVYLTTGWTAAGNQPGETRTTTLLGHSVAIRPVLVDVTYSWGDGATTGPTTDLGAPWPDGNIKHTYTKKGTYPVTITATYTATFTIDGGDPQHIGMTTTRTTTQTLTPVEYHVALTG